MDNGAFRVTPLGQDEDAVLRDAVYQAAVWWEATEERPHPARNELFAAPAYGAYVDGWGRCGDRALVARSGRTCLGVAWFRLYTEAAPSYGFVDDRTPELGIAVVPWVRGAGVGALLASLIVTATVDGFPALSLSVAAGNPARRLYERSGFTPRRETSGSTTMLRALARVHQPEEA